MRFIIAEGLITIVLAAVSIFLVQKRLSRKLLALFTGFVVVSGVIAGNVINLIPAPTEPVTITALDDKNENSTQTQVALTSIIVDGKEYELKNASEGKWFWRGDDYYWRPDSDNRRPDGLTQTIVIDVPIGNHRQIAFAAWSNRGIAEIYDGKTTQVVDTYGTDFVFVTIEKTEPYKVIAFKLFKLAVFAIIIAALMFYPAFALIRCDTEKIRSRLAHNWDKIIYVIVSATSLVFMICLGQGHDLMWGDEISNIGFSYTNNAIESIFYNARMADVNPPLFNFISHFWIKLVPYGIDNLFLLTEAMTAVGVYFVGMAGAVLKDKFTGVIACIIAAFSPTVILCAGYDFRPAPLFFMISSIALWLFLKKLSVEKISLGQHIILGITFAALMMSHYYGALIVAAFGFTDIVMLILKKVKIRDLVPYFIAGSVEILWFIIILIFKERSITESWKSAPTTMSLIDLAEFLCEGNKAMLFIFTASLISVSVYVLYKLCSKKFDRVFDSKLLAISFVIIFSILSVFVYSAYINPEGALFDNRYYIGIEPFVIVVIALGIIKAKDFLETLLRWDHTKVIDVSCLVIALIMAGGYGLKTIDHDLNASGEYIISAKNVSNIKPYEEAAQYIMEQNDIYRSNTVVITALPDAGGAEGFGYLLTHKENREKVTVIANKDITSDVLKYNKIYFCALSTVSTGKIKSVVTDNYDVVDENSSYKITVYQRRSDVKVPDA